MSTYVIIVDTLLEIKVVFDTYSVHESDYEKLKCRIPESYSCVSAACSCSGFIQLISFRPKSVNT